MQPQLTPETSGSVVVLVGSFNPAIFHPEWFLRQGLITEGEFSSAELEITHPQVCQFKTERFYFHATTERLMIGSNPNVISEPVRDIAHGVMFILEHTPIRQLGINRLMHFDVKSQERWHQVGDALAPKTIWTEVLPQRPGLETIKISSEAPGYVKGSKINIRVEPSHQITNGVFFEFNYHFETSNADVARNECMEILKTSWSEKQDDAERVASRILHWAEQPSA